VTVQFFAVDLLFPGPATAQATYEDAVSTNKVRSGHDDLVGDRNDAPAKKPTKELMRGSSSSPGITEVPQKEGMHTFRKLADAVIDLSSVTSPYSGSTTGNSDDVAVCGSGAEQGFAGILEPGSTITIGQTSNTFDSKHTLRYGGGYPGDNVVDCVDDPDTATLSFTNAGDANVPVYFIVDAYSGSGDFVVAWSGDFVAGGEFSLGAHLFDFWTVRCPISFELHVMYKFLHANPSVVAN
jgi:hypothetical protein